MKKGIMLLIAIGVFLGIFVALARPFEVNASLKNKPDYVNSREQVEKVPIIENKLLKANDQYKSLEGTIIIEKEGVTSKVNLSIEQPSRFYCEYIPNIKEPDVKIEAINNGDEVQEKDEYSNIEKSEPWVETKRPDQLEDNAVYPNYNGTFLPNAPVNEMIHPEMYAQSAFRRGELEVVGEENYLNRKTTLIQVKYKESKLGNVQKFWVDNETGIILRTVIYDNNEPVKSKYFESISFNKNISSKRFNLFTE